MDSKILLSEKEIPTNWYNFTPDLPEQLPPPIHPGTGQPIGPQDLSPIFPMELIKQEVSGERWIERPDAIIDAYKIYRPTPLHRAYRLEKELKTKKRT